jgi:hypothetical protein
MATAAALTAPCLYGQSATLWLTTCVPASVVGHRVKPSLVGAPLLRPLKAGQRPAAGASWRHGGGGQSKEGGEVGKHERQADLHLRPSGRPAIAGGSTGQRRRRAFSLRRQQAVPGNEIRVHCPLPPLYAGRPWWAKLGRAQVSVAGRPQAAPAHRPGQAPAGHSRAVWLLHAQ